MTTTRFLVPPMDCATEKELISSRVGRVHVERVDFDLLDRMVTICHRAGANAGVETALREIGLRRNAWSAFARQQRCCVTAVRYATCLPSRGRHRGRFET